MSFDPKDEVIINIQQGETPTDESGQLRSPGFYVRNSGNANDLALITWEPAEPTEHEKLMAAYERLNQKLDLVREKIRIRKARKAQVG